MSRFLVIATVFILFGDSLTNLNCEGKRMCYSCDTDTSALECLYTPDNITIVPEFQKPCKHYCTIKRAEYINIPGTVSIISLKRDCEKDPQMLDGVIAGDYFITYYRSCKSHLCNDRDGLTSLKDIPEEPDEPEEIEETSSSHGHGVHYCKSSESIRIFKIYFFAFVASIFSIT